MTQMETDSMPAMKVVLCGVGGVGRNVTRLLRARPDFRIVAACSRNPTLVGRDVGELAGGSSLGVAVSRDLATALSEPADLLLVATTSFLGEVACDVRTGLERGLNVITTAEEAAFPWIIDADLAAELDELARDRGVSVIGVGLNPGFIFDALLLTASGIAWDVREIRIRRVVDVSRFSATIQRRLGIGFTAERFADGVSGGSITGHIGFPQSFHLAARCLGVSIDRIESGFEPLVADRAYDGEHLRVEAGTTAGFVQRYRAICCGRSWMSAEFIAHVDPPAAGYEPSDSIRIDGYNAVNLDINPGCQPQLGTAAMIANVMPRLVEARPGYLTVADLALPHARPTADSFT